MKIFSFAPGMARHIGHFGSNFSIARLVHSDHIHVACMRLDSGGLIGYHQAHTHQLFAVVDGEGWVRDATSPRLRITADQAVVWQPGEHHEVGTDSGMIAIMIESEVLGSRPETFGSVTSEP